MATHTRAAKFPITETNPHSAPLVARVGAAVAIMGAVTGLVGCAHGAQASSNATQPLSPATSPPGSHSTPSSSAPSTGIDAVRSEAIVIQDPKLGPLRFNVLAAGIPAAARQGNLVLFLHGFPETAESFRQMLPAVARAGYYAVAFSQRGYSPGARPTAISDYNVLDLVSDVTRVAASLGAPTFHLVGHDWGGAIAWITAVLDPKIVSTLTVLSTPHPDALSAGIADPKNPQHVASNYMIGFRAPGSQNRILASGLKGFTALFTLGGGGIPSTDIAAYARVVGTPAALGAAIDWYRATPLPAPNVGRVSVPTLYLWGSEDSVFLRPTAQASAKYVTGPYTFCTLAGRGHWLPEDAAKQILTALLPQLAGAKGRCPSS